MTPIASVVIPAHNEASVIGRLLSALTTHEPSRFEIVVVCNGCTDETAQVVARVAPEVQVIEIAEPSKRAALRVGDDAARTFPRVYVDADVLISGRGVTRLVEALADGQALAAGPARHVPREGTSLLVRWYYDVWEQLPQVRTALFGRGVIAVSAEGYQRIRSLPALMGDDLAASDAFVPSERVLVPDAEVTVWPPRTVRDLLNRRVRAVTGNAEADVSGIRRRESITDLRSLSELTRQHPRLLVRMPVFLAVTAVARLRARRAIRLGDTKTWLRDESSRNTPGSRSG